MNSFNKTFHKCLGIGRNVNVIRELETSSSVLIAREEEEKFTVY